MAAEGLQEDTGADVKDIDATLTKAEFRLLTEVLGLRHSQLQGHVASAEVTVAKSKLPSQWPIDPRWAERHLATRKRRLAAFEVLMTKMGVRS